MAGFWHDGWHTFLTKWKRCPPSKYAGTAHNKGCISLYQHHKACISLSVAPSLPSISFLPCLLQFISGFAQRQATCVNSQWFFNKENGIEWHKKKKLFHMAINQCGTVIYKSRSSFCSLTGAFSLHPFTRLVSSCPPPIISHFSPLCKSISVIIHAVLSPVWYRWFN